MKISIENFKAIESLFEFDLSPMVVLSGTNSSGKSSFIQLLLVLKQSLELNSTSRPLDIHGDLVEIGEYLDILHRKVASNHLAVNFTFENSEVSHIGNRIDEFDAIGPHTWNIRIEFDYKDETIGVKSFSAEASWPGGDEENKFIVINIDEDEDGSVSIQTNTGIFETELFFSDLEITNVAFSAFIPIYYESITKDAKHSADFEGGEADPKKVKRVDAKAIRRIFDFDWLRKFLTDYFEGISYLGPLREQPRDNYVMKSRVVNIGSKGEYVASVLTQEAGRAITLAKASSTEEGIEYSFVESTLLDGVRYWICEVFGLASNIYGEQKEDSYRIILENEMKLLTTIKHVGFGVSQLLPIVVEGLRMREGQTLILEQPEIHLHPKVQSLLFDFLRGLINQGKHVIVETHSDHFITRMRRRVAEDLSNSLSHLINFRFIESSHGSILFRELELTNFGTMTYFPIDFIEQSTTEYKAIVKAQTIKRTQNA